MTKETVRFPDDLVDRIKGAVDESDLFESRSEFHRVSSELLLDLLDPDHEPTNFSYHELRSEIEDELGVDLAESPPFDGDGAGSSEFLEAYVMVRRRALHGDLEGAREYVEEEYDAVAVEALLLDEVIGLHRSERPGEGDRMGRIDGERSRPAGDAGPDPVRGDGDGTRSGNGRSGDAEGDRTGPPRR